MRFLILLSVLLVAVLIGGCKSSSVVDSVDLGTFRGKVTLYGVDARPLPNQGAATIEIEGTSFTTVSDSNGEWQINNVPAGIYNLLFFKPGFDTTYYLQYEFSGDGTSFLEREFVQLIPLDSVPFTVSATEKDSTIHYRDSIFYKDSIKYNVDTIVYGKDSIIVQDTAVVADTIHVDSATRSFSLSIAGTVAGPDSAIIKHVFIAFYDSTGKDSINGAIATLPSTRPFVLLPGQYPLNSLWYPNLRRGMTFYVSTRVLAEGWYSSGTQGGTISPYTVWRKVVVQ